MAKKKNIKTEDDSDEVVDKKKTGGEEDAVSEDTIDPAIIEDTFTEEFSEYNDVDNF